jgi:glycosyltransferase 2 family protein
MAMSSTEPLPRAETAPHRRLRDTLVLAALFALVLAGLAGLATATGWGEIRSQIAKLAGWQIVALLALSLVNYLLRGLRWHLFAHRLGLGTSLAADYRHYLGGFALSVTPGRLGELVRMRWIGRETGLPFETSALLMLLDRASDLASTGLLLGVALSVSASGIAFGLPATVLSLMVAAIVTRPALLKGLAAVGYRVTGRFGRLFARLRRAADALAVFSSPGLMALAGALGLVGWFAEGYAFHLLLAWMGADISVAKAVAIFIFAGFAGGLTGAPGGVGGAEATMVALLALEGVGLEVSVPATAIIRVTTLWFAILIGFAVFPVAEKYSLRQKHVVETD